MATGRKTSSGVGKAPHPFEGTTKEPAAPRGGKRDAKRVINGIEERFAPPDAPPRKRDDLPDDKVILHNVCAKEQRVAASAIDGLKESAQIYCVNCRGPFPASSFSDPSTKKAIA